MGATGSGHEPGAPLCLQDGLRQRAQPVRALRGPLEGGRICAHQRHLGMGWNQLDAHPHAELAAGAVGLLHGVRQRTRSRRHVRRADFGRLAVHRRDLGVRRQRLDTARTGDDAPVGASMGCHDVRQRAGAHGALRRGWPDVESAGGHVGVGRNGLDAACPHDESQCTLRRLPCLRHGTGADGSLWRTRAVIRGRHLGVGRHHLARAHPAAVSTSAGHGRDGLRLGPRVHAAPAVVPDHGHGHMGMERNHMVAVPAGPAAADPPCPCGGLRQRPATGQCSSVVTLRPACCCSPTLGSIT